MLLALLLVLAAVPEQPERAIREKDQAAVQELDPTSDDYPEHTGYSLGAPVAVGLTVAGPAETSNVRAELYLGFRPSFTVSPAKLKNFGFGAYGEVATLRTFEDLHVAGGFHVATPGELWIRFVPSLGAFASKDWRGWVPGLEAGLFFGMHGAYTGSTGTLGLRLIGRYFIGPPPSWTVTLALEIDAWLITTLFAWIAK